MKNRQLCVYCVYKSRYTGVCCSTLYIVLVLFEKFLLESFPPNIQNILRYFFRWKLVLELAYCNVYISSIQVIGQREKLNEKFPLRSLRKTCRRSRIERMF